MSKKNEIRIVDGSLEVRAGDDEGSGKIVGHAAVFDKETVIANLFREKVAKGAFTRAVKEDDVRALFNHDPNQVLGRTKSGTLRLKEDKKGLAVEIDPPDTQVARDALELIERGDVDQMSFGFRVTKETWEEGEDGKLDLRTIEEVELRDVSPVTFPAYDETDVGVRAHGEWRSSLPGEQVEEEEEVEETEDPKDGNAHARQRQAEAELKK